MTGEVAWSGEDVVWSAADGDDMPGDFRERVCDWLREQGGDPVNTRAVRVLAAGAVVAEVWDQPHQVDPDTDRLRWHTEMLPLRTPPPPWPQPKPRPLRAWPPPPVQPWAELVEPTPEQWVAAFTATTPEFRMVMAQTAIWAAADAARCRRADHDVLLDEVRRLDAALVVATDNADAMHAAAVAWQADWVQLARQLEQRRPPPVPELRRYHLKTRRRNRRSR